MGDPVWTVQPGSQLDNIIDVREHDVPYHVRVAIDSKINVGHWYTVRGRGSEPPDIRLVEDEPDRPVSQYPYSIPHTPFSVLHFALLL